MAGWTRPGAATGPAQRDAYHSGHCPMAVLAEALAGLAGRLDATPVDAGVVIAVNGFLKSTLPGQVPDRPPGPVTAAE